MDLMNDKKTHSYLRLPCKIGLAAFSGILMLLAYPDYNYYLLVWIGFIPLFLALEDATYKETYWLSVIMGMIPVCGGYPWISHVVTAYLRVPPPLNYLMWLLAGFYISQLFALIFLTVAYLKKNTRIPILLIFPAVTVTLWSYFPNMFHFTLANGTAPFLPAIQATQFTGESGLSFMIALSNITGYQLLRYPARRKGMAWIAAALAVIIIWFGYGTASLKIWDNKIDTWEKKKIGIVQPNRPSSLSILPPEPGYSRTNPLEIDLSRRLASQGADLIVWPEGQYFGYMHEPGVRNAFNSAVRQMGADLIFHDKMIDQRRLYRNSAIWLRGNGNLGDIYHKRHLVPIGEYIPVFGYDKSFVERYGIPPSLTPGEDIKSFPAAGMNIIPLICYEIQFSRFVAEAVAVEKTGQVILTQSNDGWFGKGTMSAQHRSSNILRAVENRAPVIHVINNGASEVVSPSGRSLFLSKVWTRGSWVVEMPYNEKSGGSFFSAHPNLFLNLVRFSFLLFFLYLFRYRRSLKEKRPKKTKKHARRK